MIAQINCNRAVSIWQVVFVPAAFNLRNPKTHCKNVRSFKLQLMGKNRKLVMPLKRKFDENTVLFRYATPFQFFWKFVPRSSFSRRIRSRHYTARTCLHLPRKYQIEWAAHKLENFHLKFTCWRRNRGSRFFHVACRKRFWGVAGLFLALRFRRQLKISLDAEKSTGITANTVPTVFLAFFEKNFGYF